MNIPRNHKTATMETAVTSGHARAGGCRWGEMKCAWALLYLLTYAYVREYGYLGLCFPFKLLVARAGPAVLALGRGE